MKVFNSFLPEFLYPFFQSHKYKLSIHECMICHLKGLGMCCSKFISKLGKGNQSFDNNNVPKALISTHTIGTQPQTISHWKELYYKCIKHKKVKCCRGGQPYQMHVHQGVQFHSWNELTSPRPFLWHNVSAILQNGIDNVIEILRQLMNREVA